MLKWCLGGIYKSYTQQTVLFLVFQNKKLKCKYFIKQYVMQLACPAS